MYTLQTQACSAAAFTYSSTQLGPKHGSRKYTGTNDNDSNILNVRSYVPVKGIKLQPQGDDRGY